MERWVAREGRPQHREGDPEGWSTVLVTALGSWEKTVPRSQQHMDNIHNKCVVYVSNMVQEGAVWRVNTAHT